MKNKFLNFMAIALSAVLLPVSVVYADNSADYVHVDV